MEQKKEAKKEPKKTVKKEVKKAVTKNDVISQKNQEIKNNLNKVLSILFIVFFIGTLFFDFIAISNLTDTCRAFDKPCQYAFGTNDMIVNKTFINILWIEGFVAIIVSTIYSVVALINKKWIKAIIGIIGILIIPIVWGYALNITWGVNAFM